MRELGKEHGRQMAENAESAGFCLYPSFLGYLMENVSRYKVEKLLEDDNISARWFLVHTLLSDRDPFSRPLFLAYFVIPVGWL